MDNLHAVLHQIEAFGIELKDKDQDKIRGLGAGGAIEGKRYTCGAKGKDWFKFYIFRPDRGGGSFITGSFGTYRQGGSWEKVEHDWAPLSEAERERQAAERQAKIEQAARKREEERALAAMEAGDLWRLAAKEGRSPYLERKGLVGESCRYLADGTLVLLLLRYDLPRDQAVQAAQRILPDGRKFYTAGFAKPGCSLRLGTVDDTTPLLLVVEGYATGLTVRAAVDHRIPVFVAFDAGNLAHVVPLLHELHPELRILVCADDDWRTRDKITGQLNNPGRTAAKAIAKQVPFVDLVYPVFNLAKRKDGDTDFDDLRTREGLDVVRRQLQGVVRMMERVYG